MTQDKAPVADDAAEQTEIPENDFVQFGFDKAIMKAIKKEGFLKPTPIQEMSIFPVMSGSDLMGIAQTGSGKTAAFCLPTMNKLLYGYERPQPKKPKVLILAPTRELVMQIGKFIEMFSRGTPLKNLVIAGGQAYPPQIRKLKQGVDILIATPGRLMDHMDNGVVKLEECGTFILDEADRMLDMGFIDEVKTIQSSLTEEHQTVMFTATMNDKVRRLSQSLLNEPEYVEQERKTMVADTITHKLMNVRRGNKTKLLIQLLQDETIDKALVFARTKLGADNICDELKEAFLDTPIRIDAIHGDKKQRTREKILLNFRKGRTKVLVATDVAARGIDVDGITHVINYELPIEAENYVHRVGRTGRAGEEGYAISFCDPSDVRLLKEIEKLTKLPIEIDEDQPYHIDIDSKGDTKGKPRRRPRNRRDRGDRGERRDRGDRQRSDRKRPDRKRSERPNRSERPKREDRPQRSERSNRDERPNRRERPKKDNNFKRERKSYDPLMGNTEFDDDPVMQKLRGVTKSRKKKTAAKESHVKPKSTNPKSDKPKRKSVKNSASQSRGKVKQTGGHKAFSPKRKKR